MRNPLRRSVHPPVDVVRAAALPHGEHVLAATRTNDGAWLLGTRDAFLVVRDGVLALRLVWEAIERAEWDGEAERFRVLEVGTFGQPRGEHGFLVDDPGLMLEFVRERVTASVVLQRRFTVRDRRGFFVIARRPPSGQGEIRWAVEYDPGIEPDDPEVAAASEQALRATADEVGPG